MYANNSSCNSAEAQMVSEDSWKGRLSPDQTDMEYHTE